MRQQQVTMQLLQVFLGSADIGSAVTIVWTQGLMHRLRMQTLYTVNSVLVTRKPRDLSEPC